MHAKLTPRQKKEIAGGGALLGTLVLGGLAYPAAFMLWFSLLAVIPQDYEVLIFVLWVVSLAVLGIGFRRRPRPSRWAFMWGGTLSLALLSFAFSEESPDLLPLFGGASFGLLGSLVFGVASRTFPWVPVAPLVDISRT